jgi:hypothetical protein
MRFSRARYVTLCQQSLVTATVLVVGVSAAGVRTLDIVPAPAQVTDARGTSGLHQAQPVPNSTPPPAKTEVDATPVTPKVREVKVAPAAPARAQRTAPQRQVVDDKPLVALSAPQRVSGYATVGVTWRHGIELPENQVGIQVRTAKAGRWSGWMPVQYHDDHGPDGDAGELTPKARPGTDALVIGDVDQVQMRAENATGRPIPDLQLAVIDPGTGKMTAQRPAIDTATLASSSRAATKPASQSVTSTDGTSDDVALSAMRRAPKPYIYSRAQWGANEKMREQGLPNYGTVKAGFIHHTVNANNYTAAQVPALLRGIYAYHTQSRGWRDIGYNYLVDRFGRIWEGRYGGVDKAVVGAHTLGYNEVSFAMSAIGNYDITQPPQAILNAYARLFAWKLSLYNIRADATHIWLKDRYVNAINGHRDVGHTACPGRYLYAKIPTIRVMAQRIQNAAQTGAPVTLPTPPDPNAMTTPTQTPKPAAVQPQGIRFPRSLNLAGDSAPDLVLKRSDGTVSVVPTGGQVGYRAPVSTPGNWRAFNMVTAVGDVTGDRRGDVLVRARNGVSGIYSGDGYGHVRGPLVGLTPRFRYADLVVPAGDWNHDGHADVIMRDHRTGSLWLVKGAGHGRFGGNKLLSRSFRGFSRVTVVRDVTGDGRSDVLGLHRNGYLYLARATRKGKLGHLLRRSHVGSSYSALLGGVSDQTGDGRSDVVVRSARTGQLAILPGKGWAWFARPYGPFTGVPALARLSSAQMTGSGAADLVGVSTDGKRLVVVPNNGLTNLHATLPSNLRAADIVQVLNVGDWNGDGRGDIITRQNGGNSLYLRPGLGNGRFANGIGMHYGWKSFTNLAAVGDVTGDGHPDLMGRTASGVTEIFPGDGRTGFRVPVTAANYVRTFNQIGTGYWKPQQFPTSTYLGANGSFVPFRGTGAGAIPGYTWVVGPGDVDGDGRPDLVARDRSGALWLLPGTESGYAQRRLIGEGFSSYTLGG